MFNPNMAQRVNERYRRLLISSGWVLPESGAELILNYDFVAQPNLEAQVNPATGAPGGPTLDITRTTTKMFSDWEGLLRTVQAGEATFTGCRRVENLVIQSENLAGGTWTKTNIAVVNNAALINGVSLSRLTDNTTDGQHKIHDANIVPVPVPTRQLYTISAYVKGGTSPYIGMGLVSNPGESSIFDTSTETWPKQQGNHINHDFVNLGNGFYRISFTAKFVSNWDDILVGMSSDGTTTSYVGTGKTIFVGGVQVENNSGQADTSPSEYLPTTTVPVFQTFPTQKNGLPFPNAMIGLLPEEARTNLQVQSSVHNGSAWSEANCTIDADVAVAPDGTFTMDRFNTGTVAQTHIHFDAKSTGADVVHCLSQYFKADGNNFPGLTFSDAGENHFSAVFNLANGTVGSTDVGTTSGTIVGSGIEDVGNGIFRCWVSGSVSSTITNNFIVFNSDSATPTYTSAGYVSWEPTAGEDFFLWGSQLEAAAYPSSYIPTPGVSTVTRNSDDVSTTDLTSIDARQGTYYISVVLGSADSGFYAGSPRTLEFNNSGAPDVDRLLLIVAGTIDPFVIQEGNDSATNSDSDAHLAVGASFKQVAAYDGTSGLISYVNGTAGPATASITVPDNANDFNILTVGSRYNGTLQINGHIASVRYYNKRATTGESEDLSNGLLAP